MARRRSQSRRRGRHRNPVPTWGIVAGATVAAAAVGYGGYRFFKRRHAGGAAGGLEGGGAPLPPGEIACEIGPDYPGFVQAEDGSCVASGTTPAGIYVDRACNDFVFVDGDEGPQVDNLELLIAAARGSSMAVQGNSADPIVITTAFLHKFWPNCTWPPQVDGPARLVHMFEALNFLVGRTIVEEGGRVLGTKSMSIVDELIADRLTKLGLPEFQQEIVPELSISGPDHWLGPGAPKGPGLEGTSGEPTEIAALKQKLCNAPGDLNAFEKVTLINEVISPLLDARVEALGVNPSYDDLIEMFSNVGRRALLGCPPVKRNAGIQLATKFAHDLWVQRYHGGQPLVPPAPPPPPWHPPTGPGGLHSPKLPACAVDPYTRTKTVDLPQVAWHARKSYEFKVFEFTGQWADCLSYDLLVGVCLRIKGATPYGLISQYIADPSMDFSLAKARIRNGMPAALGDDNGGGPILWDQFRSPPTWKYQLRTEVGMTIWNGQKQVKPVIQSDIHNVTGSVDAKIVDPCQNLAPHWPISNQGIFGVVAWDGSWYPWDSVPTVEIYKNGMAIYVRVTYMGVPSFKWKDNDARAIFSLSEPVLEIRSLARGKTP